MVAYVPEEDNGVSVRGPVQHGLEVRGTGRQDHFVGLELEAVAGQRDVDEGFMMEQIFKDAQQIVLVVVPT